MTRIKPVDEFRRMLREELRFITIFVDNGLDQDVSIQVVANREPSHNKRVNIGSSFTVSAGSTYARSLSVETSGWLPYVSCVAVCSTAPTSGALTVYRIRSRGDEAKIFDALEIRDTLAHDGNVVEW